MTPCSFVDYYEILDKNVASCIRVEYEGKVKNEEAYPAIYS
jgi:hypothetical protein